MNIRKMTLGILLIVTLITVMGCSSNKADTDTPTTSPGKADTDHRTDSTETVKTPSQTEEEQKKVMEDFNNLINNNENNLKEVITFIDKNISSTSPEDASIMLMKLEELQIKYRLTLEEEYVNENTQLLFYTIDLDGVDYNNPEKLQDELSEMVKKTRDSGYKIEQAEGFYYPVIDYSIYAKYTANVNPDIKAYFGIMETESDQVYAKDAALRIDWSEVIQRGLITEDFLKKYPNFSKYDDIKNLYNRYVSAFMYGLNNTPLFDYETNKINEEAKTTYEEAIKNNKDSDFIYLLKGFMEVLSKNNYKLTDEVEQYRDNITQSQETTQSDTNPYSVAGIEDVKEFEDTFHLLQGFVSNDEKEKLAEYVAYPINVSINGTKTAIKNETEFVKNYDKILTEEVKKVFLSQMLDNIFVNYQGVMIGNGEIWINQIVGTKHLYSIYAINNE